MVCGQGARTRRTEARCGDRGQQAHDFDGSVAGRLGFEPAPRTDAERKATADMLAGLRSPDKDTARSVTGTAGQCALSKAEVRAPALEPGGKPAAKDERADLDARYESSCAQPGEPRRLDVGLFEACKRIQRIDLQVAGPKGQAKATLKRPTRSVKLVR
jgi:hypothetical protein